MNTPQGTFRDRYGSDVRSVVIKNSEIRISKVKSQFGFDNVPDNTATTHAVNVSATNWLTPIVGAFDNDPVYAQAIENIKENRRRLAEEYCSVE